MGQSEHHGYRDRERERDRERQRERVTERERERLLRISFLAFISELFTYKGLHFTSLILREKKRMEARGR